MKTIRAIDISQNSSLTRASLNKIIISNRKTSRENIFLFDEEVYPSDAADLNTVSFKHPCAYYASIVRIITMNSLILRKEPVRLIINSPGINDISLGFDKESYNRYVDHMKMYYGLELEYRSEVDHRPGILRFTEYYSPHDPDEDLYEDYDDDGDDGNDSENDITPPSPDIKMSPGRGFFGGNAGFLEWLSGLTKY